MIWLDFGFSNTYIGETFEKYSIFQLKGESEMKKIVAIIVSGFATAAILIWSLTMSIDSQYAQHGEHQPEHAAVTHSAGH